MATADLDQLQKSRVTRHENVRFSVQSLRVRDHLRDLIVENLRQLAATHAIKCQREVVTEEDFEVVFPDALAAALERFRAEKSR